MHRVYNFSAGPAVLPEEVLREAADEMLDYQGTGMSVMEMSHRSAAFDEIIKTAEQDLRDLMGIPDNYKVLFLQGGASQQFAAVPMNLMKNGVADYIVTGQWAKKAYQEAQKYGKAVKVASSEDKTFSYIPDCSDLPIDDDADYVYESEKLATLSGKKLHAKRNHINKFKATFENWNFEALTEDNVEECFQMALNWRRENGCEDDVEKNAEMCVTLNALRLREELELTGGVLRVNGEVVAFTLGEPVCEDTFVVHIEKAYAEVPGAYPMINQLFAKQVYDRYRYINREEDTGAEGLRKAKLSYYPVFMVEKGVVKEKVQ